MKISRTRKFLASFLIVAFVALMTGWIDVHKVSAAPATYNTFHFTATATSPISVITTSFLTGDVMIANGFTAALGGTPPAVMTAPAGWTEIQTGTVSIAGGAFSLRYHSWYRIGEASIPATYDFTQPAGALTGAAFVEAFTGGDQSNPIQTSLTGTYGSTATPTATGITTTVADELVHTFFFGADGGAAATWTPPTGMTETFDTQGSEGAYVAQAGAGASGNKQATASKALEGWWITLGINPAPVAAAYVPEQPFIALNDE